jgi:V/A-type H+-transporting ATPase subunit D
MPKLAVPPTKTSLLSLRQQLGFAEEGFDLLEQKRQILIFELMRRLERAVATQERLARMLAAAFDALREACLDAGGEAIDRAALAVAETVEVNITEPRLMGLRLPRVTLAAPAFGIRYGFSDTSASCDQAMRQFLEVLPVIAELAELETAIIRLARELRKTQRRCNALSKIFIPNYRETIRYIVEALEERERESFTILKMIQERLAQKRG